MSDLLYGEVEEELRGTVRALLDDRAPLAATLARTESGATADADVWRALAADVGVAGLPVPEDRGGAGASWRETAVVAEEFGRAVAPVPYLGSAVLATAALLAAGETELLAALAAGTATAVLAVGFGRAPDDPGAVVTVDSGTLTGSIAGVADATAADVLLVPAGAELYAVETGQAAVTRSGVVSLDMTRQLTDLRLDRAPGRSVAAGERAADALRSAALAGSVVLASEQVGLARRSLQTTVDYVKSRYQFGRPVGSFQAVKHRIADLWTEVAQATAVARHAADCLAAGDADLPVAAALAGAYCGEVAVHVAQEAIQLHGGIGFTWEHPAHLYLKRAKANALAFGGADRHLARLADLVNIPA